MTDKRLNRLNKIIELREVDDLSFRDIGRLFGVSGSRARQLYRQGLYFTNEWPKQWDYPLSVRASYVLINAGIHSKAMAQAMVKREGWYFFKTIRNCGIKTYREIEQWSKS